MSTTNKNLLEIAFELLREYMNTTKDQDKKVMVHQLSQVIRGFAKLLREKNNRCPYKPGSRETKLWTEGYLACINESLLEGFTLRAEENFNKRFQAN